MKDDVGIIVQARLGSTRLPGKMLIPFFQELSILEIILTRLKKAFKSTKIILATTILPNDDRIVDLCEKLSVTAFRGDENNVLSRFIEAAETNNIKNIVRVCADNPFILPEYIVDLINVFDSEKVDYLSFSFEDKTPVIKSHLGLFAEMTTLSALKQVANMTDNPFYYEHVTNYMYEHPQNFRIKFLTLPEILLGRKDIRLTVDTRADFELSKKLYSELFANQINLNAIISKIDSDKYYTTIMAEEIKNQKK